MSFSFFSKLRQKKQHLRLIRDQLQHVRLTISEQTNDFSPHVRRYMAEICRGRGKMIRPGLVLLTAAATGGIREEHVTFAALVEMLHMATLIHDDVLMFQRPMRCGEMNWLFFSGTRSWRKPW